MSECGCLYVYWDSGDNPVCSSSGWTKARKPHTCCECDRPIVKGERYYRFAGKWEGRFSTFRTCAECHDIASSLYCEGRTFQQLWEDIEEQIFEEQGLTVACIDKLTTPESKAYLQQRWMQFVEQRGGQGREPR